MSANEHDDDEPDMEDVIERLRDQNARLREHIEKIVGRAQWYARTAEIQEEFADMARAALKA
jgi:hypothetical protein